MADRSAGPVGRSRTLRTVLDTALDLVLPRICPGCHAPVPWCGSCAATLAGRPRAVAIPDAALDRMASAGLAMPPVHALTRYTGPARAAVLAGKERGRTDLPPLLGRALGVGLVRLQNAGIIAQDVWLVPAPTRRSAARARGGDPVLAMAGSAARLLAGRGRVCGVAPCLWLARGTRDSVGLDAAQRAANLADHVRFRSRGAPAAAAAAVLLDDVLTTGATVTASVAVLAQHDIAVCAVLVLAAVPPFRPALLAPRSEARPER